MKIVRTPEGKRFLHMWRTGTAFESPVRGSLYREWNNLKFAALPYPDPPHFRHRDLRKPLPYPADTFDAVYCNHVLEHLQPSEGKALVREIRRVLQPSGICRLVTPDLEKSAAEYLACLRAYDAEPTDPNRCRYEWALVELIDQMVRQKSGGIMLEKLRREDIDAEQVRRTSGDALNRFLGPVLHAQSPFQRLAALASKHGFLHASKAVACRLTRDLILRLSDRSEAELRSERSLWMYDRVSLREVLERSGFSDIQVLDFKTSRIPGWSRYRFDQSEDGNYPWEPSVYVEGRKPRRETI